MFAYKLPVQKGLNKCFLDTTCKLMYLVRLDFQPHNSALPLSKVINNVVFYWHTPLLNCSSGSKLGLSQ